MLRGLLCLLDRYLQFRHPHFDSIAVFDRDFGVTTFGPLFGSFALFARSVFLSVDPRPVQAARDRAGMPAAD